MLETMAFNDGYVLCEINGDGEENLYDGEDLLNKDMNDPIIFYKSFRDSMETYFGAPLNTTIELLEDINGVELKFRVEKYEKKLQVDFIGHRHHKLNFQTHRLKTCYFMDKLAKILYLNSLFI